MNTVQMVWLNSVYFWFHYLTSFKHDDDGDFAFTQSFLHGFRHYSFNVQIEWGDWMSDGLLWVEL